MAGWPFWAATSDERIEQALDFAGVTAGVRLVDLGCGDGRVLLRAAAFRGAVVTGVELDPALAASARTLLADHGVEGEIIEADFREAPIDADVVFCYLSPATLQRLKPRLASLPAGTRVVTAGYAIPGWLPEKAGGRCYLYGIPPTADSHDPAARGWDAAAGVIVSMHPDKPSLVGVKLHHGGGPVEVRVCGEALSGMATVLTGMDLATPGDEVVIDVRFDPRPAGTLAAGHLEAPGEAPFHIFAAVDDGEMGIWGVPAQSCAAVAERFVRGDVASVLAGARSAAN